LELRFEPGRRRLERHGAGGRIGEYPHNRQAHTSIDKKGTNQTQTAIHLAIRVGRATALAIGLGVSLALLLGAATVALAAVPGDPLKLGRVNTINAVSTLVGSVSGSMLTVDNNSTALGATALDLRVEPTRDPLKVNSTSKVDNLNVDRLDNFNSSDFVTDGSREVLPNDTYVNEASKLGPGSSGIVLASVDCDPGDKLLGGGGQAANPSEDTATASVPSVDGQGWDYQIRDNGNASFVDAFVVCADFPPEHQ